MIDTMDLGASATQEEGNDQPVFDLANDPVPSFATLQQERSGVYSRRRAY